MIDCSVHLNNIEWIEYQMEIGVGVDLKELLHVISAFAFSFDL